MQRTLCLVKGWGAAGNYFSENLAHRVEAALDPAAHVHPPAH